MATSKEEKELWLEFAHDAASMYSKPEDIDEEDVVDDMADVASGYADAMLDAFNDRFNETVSKRRRKVRKEEDE
jgi:hypothetical protein